MSKETIKPEDIIGFTKSPDGHRYLNLKDFRQVEVSEAVWSKARELKQQAKPGVAS